MKKFYIKSYNENAHRFEIAGGAVEIPSIWAKPKNIAEVTEDQFEKLMECDEFKVLMNAKRGQFVKLDTMPRDALDAQARLSEAADRTREAQADAEQARKEVDDAKLQIEKLSRQLEEAGGAPESTDTAVLTAQAEAEKARAEASEALAEVARLREQLEAKKPKAKA